MPHYQADDENDGASLSDTTQKEVIQWLFFGGALAGLCGACVSLLAYACFPRTRTRQHFAIVNIALSDLVSAVVDYDREQLRADRAAGEAGDPDPPPRFYWIDAFCASQPLLANKFNAERFDAGAPQRRAREEEDGLFEAALAGCAELVLVCAPLVGGWTAPAHPFLAAARERKGELPCGVLPSGELPHADDRWERQIQQRVSSRDLPE